jgi:hypothetical protein
MVVLMADRELGLIRRDAGPLDAHGDAPVQGRSVLAGPWPGRARLETDGSWTLAVDIAAWPMEERDIILDPVNGIEWVAVTVQPLRNTMDSSVDYVRVTALIREGTDSTPIKPNGGQVGPA